MSQERQRSKPSSVSERAQRTRPDRVRVKICGITRPEDAIAAEAAGADAVGLVFALHSRRRVSIEQAASVSAALGPFISRVGVFVDAPAAFVLEAVAAARLNAVQLHGNETAGFAAELRSRVPVVRAVSFSPADTPEAHADYPADALLLDGAVPGSGRPFAWSDAGAWRAHPRLILAGGLTPSNVAAGIDALAPYAVDVASGVEASPGVKSARLISEFMLAVRTTTARS